LLKRGFLKVALLTAAQVLMLLLIEHLSLNMIFCLGWVQFLAAVSENDCSMLCIKVHLLENGSLGDTYTLWKLMLIGVNRGLLQYFVCT
jgi:hypothetical protein